MTAWGTASIPVNSLALLTHVSYTRHTDASLFLSKSEASSS
jgi:hypothetical protein